MFIKIKQLWICTLFILGLACSAQATLIDSTHGAGAGSFELGTFTDGGGGFEWLVPTSTTITGWTVGGPGDGVDWLNEPNFDAAAGTKSVDLQHTTNSSISTTFPTVAGNPYVLSFDAAAVTGFDTAGQVSVVGGLGSTAFNAPFSPTFNPLTYQTFTFNFVANAATSTLTFAGNGAGTTAGPIIDRVSVNAIPEPSPLALLGAVLVPFAGVQLWRRRSSAVSAE